MPKQLQIFYDQKNNRWRHSKRTMLVISAFLIASFIVLIISILVKSPLPKLSLNENVSPLRNAQMYPQKSSGYTPYIKTIPEKTITERKQSKVFAYYVNWDDNSFSSLKENINNIDTLVPEWLYLKNDNGEIGVIEETRQKETLAYLKRTRKDLPIHVLINNYDNKSQQWDEKRLAKVLSSPQSRSLLIDQLIAFAVNNQLQGISIDFENIQQSQVGNVELFMAELFQRSHSLNLVVSQAVPLESTYNLKALSENNDYLVFMAYDEATINFTKQGPIASQGWFEKNIKYVFSQVPSEKIVIAIGGYGYDWVGTTVDGNVLSFHETMTIADKSKAEIMFDDAYLNPRFDYYEKNQLHHVWFLDAATAHNQILFAESYGSPYGYALWRLGSEDPSIWNVFNLRNSDENEIRSDLEKILFFNDVVYDGNGEILQAIREPSEGKRSIQVDKKTKIITHEKYEKMPSSYLVSRWGGESKNKIALTFDDGPDKGYTPQILDILKRYDVPATFFVIGMNANLNTDILRRIYIEGHEIGNHTYTHPNVAAISEEQFGIELDTSQRLLEGVLGKKSLLFRPPYSEDVNPEKPEDMKPLLTTHGLGYYTVGMNIDPKDWEKPGKDKIVERVINDAKSGKGNIVLLHDSGGDRSQTVEALPEIIEGLQKEGFEIVTVSNLLNVSPESIMPSVKWPEYILAKSNGVFFHLVGYFLQFVRIVFFVGILLGSFRFVFLSILALAQAYHCRKVFFRNGNKPFKPNVSVVIPAYNEEKVIVATVKSILNSNYEKLDIVIVNDGSTDTTNYRLHDAFDGNKKVRILKQENSGKADALNYGISQTNSEIIVTLDADTIFLPNTIEKLIRGFQDSRVAAIAGNAKVGNRLNILTKWQALEYIISQNLDRRAFEFINCISVVPGSIGAWKKSAIIEAGGFSSQTLAEDADLTFAILRNGHLISYEEDAIALTEAPESVKNFIKQRFRWMYGTLQTAWKHKKALLTGENSALTFFSLPNIFIFQILFPLIAPIMDLMFILSLIWLAWQSFFHQIDFTVTNTFNQILSYYLFFLFIDIISAAVPFSLERKEQWRLLIWLPLQRFFYRQLMYYVAIKTTLTAIKGTVVSWGKFERKASVLEN